MRGRAVADDLVQRHDRLGPGLKLRDWLASELGADVAALALSSIDDTDDQSIIRRRMGFDFRTYGRVLADLGYPPLNSEADFRRLHAGYRSVTGTARLGKSALTPHQQAEALRKLDAGDTQRSVAALFNVSQATISRLQGRP